MLMILQADTYQYSDLLKSLFMVMYKGNNEFSTTVTQAYDLLQHIARDNILSYTNNRNNSCHSRFGFRRAHKCHVPFAQTVDPKDIIKGKMDLRFHTWNVTLTINLVNI